MSDTDPAEVSEFETPDPSPRAPRAASERYKRDLAEMFTPAAEPRREREGLPPSYRMRADAHYVEQITSRTTDIAVRFVAVEEIDPLPVTEGARLDALTQSVVKHGVLQPILIRTSADGDRFRLIAGRHRLAAARRAGLTRVPCVVHQADDEAAEVLAAAADLRAGSEDGALSNSAMAAASSTMLLSEAVSGIDTAVGMLSANSPTMTRRVGLDLLRAQSTRASWLLGASALVNRSHRPELRPCLLGAVLQRVRDEFASESRLRGVDVQACVPDWNVSAEVDEKALSFGIAGAVIALIELMNRPEGGVITLMAAPAGGSLCVDVAQDTMAVPAGVREHFFDPGWSDRPGGWAATLGASAAKAAAAIHGGDAFLVPQDAGFAVRLALGRCR